MARFGHVNNLIKADAVPRAFSMGLPCPWSRPKSSTPCSLRLGDAEEILQMIDAWKKKFEQESVLRVDTPVCATF